jgi:hypothetical protein
MKIVERQSNRKKDQRHAHPNQFDRLADLEAKYKSYQSKQCNRGKNITNPSLCDASKAYNGFLKSFVDQTKKELSATPTSNTTSGAAAAVTDGYGFPLVYPRANHDFDYRTAAKIKYNPFVQGFTNEPTISNLFSAPKHIGTYIGAMTSSSLLDASSKAGVTDRWRGGKVVEEPLPYPGFRTEFPEYRYPTTGVDSSSYFINVGTRVDDTIRDKTTCARSGLIWLSKNDADAAAMASTSEYTKTIPATTNGSTAVHDKQVAEETNGICVKPRYSYIKADLTNGRGGLLHSMFDDVVDMGKAFV